MEEDREELALNEKGMLRMFKKDVARIPLLTREKELDVARQARAGDQAAAELLIESNLRFVLHMVFKFWHPGLSLMDLIAEGCKGLMNACRTFDPEMGCRLVSYAEPAIRHNLYTALRLQSLHSHDSLDHLAFPSAEEGETTLKDLLISEDPDADEAIYIRQVRRMLLELDDRSRVIIVLLYWHDLTLEEVGLRVGIKKDRVRQIEVRSLRKMRWSYQANFGADLRVGTKKERACQIEALYRRKKRRSYQASFADDHG